MNPEKMIHTYIGVFVALLVLTATTTAVAFVDLGAPWNTILALGIAVVKASLVVLFFMHALYSRPLTWVFIGAGFFCLIILFTFILADYATRDNLGAGPLAAVPAPSQGAAQRPMEILPRGAN